MNHFILTTATALMTTLTNGEPMKLINTQTGYVVVEFANGKATFNDRFLEAEMKETGIWIPPIQTSQYGGKEVIYLNDPLFEKAFVEIYYPQCISPILYQWQK